MPRPGSRPYERARRAWHSDRHRPVRGSLIQEIFRIVNEVHCSATRSNREWQEKLPIVVLKAEEIMYSKANSEAEYSDLQTLWNRVNDAIDTIIRRDESTETGKLLQPCIEAALLLGCNPERSSRSQRNETRRHYLRPERLEGTPVLESNSNTKFCGIQETINPLMLHCPKYPTFYPINPLNFFLKAQDCSSRSRSSTDVEKFPMLPKNFALSDVCHARPQTSASSKKWAVYPLYYRNQFPPDDREFYSAKPSNLNSHLMENDETGAQKSFSTIKLASLDSICPSNDDHSLDKEHGFECDLTLRLGSLVVPCDNIEPQQLENGNRGTLERRKSKSRLNI